MFVYREIPYGSVEYMACRQLRHDVLRAPLGLALSDKDVEGEEKQYHLAAYEGHALCGLILAKPLSNTLIKLRQMAVHKNYQGKGLGRQIMLFAESFARQKAFEEAELNARMYAQGFYEKLGYKPVGNPFEEVTIPTIKMVKSLH